MENKGVVVDANIIRGFFNSMKNKGLIVFFIEDILDEYGMAYSSEIKYEWQSKINKQVFDIWFELYYTQGKLKEFNQIQKLNLSERKKIFNEYGFPRAKDLHYINCAINTQIKYIVTKDIDFYDPTKKNCNKKERIRIVDKKQGQFCKFLQRRHEIRVGTPNHCCEDLTIKEKVIARSKIAI